MTADHHYPTGSPPGRSGERTYVPLFWRLFLPNAAVLGTASALLMLSPPNGRVPTIVGGFLVLTAVNLTLMRHAFAPLVRLTELARLVDPLRPGQRVPLEGPNTEVRILAESLNEMLNRMEIERRDSARRALAVEQDQRRQIARELHDDLGQDLTAIRLQVSTLEHQLGSQHRATAASLRQQLDDALSSLRRIARLLRPEALDDLGLPAALVALCERLSQRADVRIDARVSRALPKLSVEGELVLFRIAQESLTNVVRHARTPEAVLSLDEHEGCVVLTVSDQGQGFDPSAPNEGQGIRGMRERALLVDADLAITTDPGTGTQVRLAVPADTA